MSGHPDNQKPFLSGSVSLKQIEPESLLTFPSQLQASLHQVDQAKRLLDARRVMTSELEVALLDPIACPWAGVRSSTATAGGPLSQQLEADFAWCMLKMHQEMDRLEHIQQQARVQLAGWLNAQFAPLFAQGLIEVS